MPCPPLVLFLAAPLNSVNSVAGLCGWALCPLLPAPGSVSRPGPPVVLLLPAPHELCQLCGWAVWLGSVSRLSSSCPRCPPLVLLLAATLNSVNSVAGLCVAGLCGARSDIRSRKARSERALQRERQRKINLKRMREREREREKESRASARARVLWTAYWLLSSSCPLCWALWLGLVLFLSSSCPCLGRAPELCGWALWPGSVSGSCPPLVLVLATPLNSVAALCPLVLVLAAPLNSVAGLCGPAYWRGVWPNK